MAVLDNNLAQNRDRRLQDISNSRTLQPAIDHVICLEKKKKKERKENTPTPTAVLATLLKNVAGQRLQTLFTTSQQPLWCIHQVNRTCRLQTAAAVERKERSRDRLQTDPLPI
jgi:hypothetical protein